VYVSINHRKIRQQTIQNLTDMLIFQSQLTLCSQMILMN